MNEERTDAALLSSDLFAEFRLLVRQLDDLSFNTLGDPDCEALCEAI